MIRGPRHNFPTDAFSLNFFFFFKEKLKRKAETAPDASEKKAKQDETAVE